MLRKSTIRLLLLLLVLAMCVCTLSVSVSAAEDSPTKQEIRQKWKTVTSATSTFVTTPSITAPYATGKLSDSLLQSGLTYFNFVRFVAGLPEVQLDDTLNLDSQHGAVTLAALDTLTHYPSQPNGMDDDFYARAYGATTSANIGTNWGYSPLKCLQVTVESCMDDNSSYTNLSTVGHRRWILNPTLDKIGFGYAQADSGWNYIVNHVHSRSGAGCDYDFIAWPVAGNHPSNLFNTKNPWSITLNTSIYNPPSADSVKITITRQADGKTWSFDSTTGQPYSSENAYMTVNTQWYAIPNCIIFHPGSANVDSYEGVFTVDISGLSYTDGSSATLHYEVDFFDPTAACTKHEYETFTTPATCTKGGYTTYTCACGDSYVADEVPALGHKYTDRVCTRCGYTVVLNTPAKPYKIVNVVSGVHVYWKATEGAQKYGVWRSETGKDGTYKWMANPTVPHFTDTTAKSGKTYYYRVTSMAEGFHSDKSDAIGITYVSTPDISGRTNTASGVKLDWKKITGATGYAIYRKSYAGTDAWVRVATISGGNTLTWTDTSVKNNNGEVYKYTIRALYGNTLSGCRNAGRTMVRLSSQVLSSAAKASSTSVKCAWTTSSRVTGYEVRFVVNGSVYKTFTVGNYKTGVKTFTGLKAGQTYTVQVRTYKKVEGVGSFYSDWSTAKTVNT